MKHAMMVNLCQRLHFAPFQEGKPEGGGGFNILDIGTGTGIWAIESMSLPVIRGDVGNGMLIGRSG